MSYKLHKKIFYKKGKKYTEWYLPADQQERLAKENNEKIQKQIRDGSLKKARREMGIRDEECIVYYLEDLYP